MERWTIKALSELNSIQFARAILTERLNNVSQYSPLGIKLREACNDLNQLDGKPSRERIRVAEKVLRDNGIDADEAPIVLQAVCYCLLNLEIFEEDTEHVMP